MRRVLSTLAVVFMLGTSALAAQSEVLPDTPGNRAAQAKRYLEASPPREVIEEVSASMAASLPAHERERIEILFQEHFDFEALEEFLETTLAKHFTAEELKALADFYGSPAGKSAMSKFGAYMADSMPFIKEEVAKALLRSRQNAE